MSDNERITRAKKQADESAYKRGYRDGVDVSVWAAFATCCFVYFVLQFIDAAK